MAPGTPIGRHLIADLSGVAPEVLRDSDRIMAALEAGLTRSGFHCLRQVVHPFEERGAGFTGIVLLAESHAAVHTYPEHGYLALDIFGCGDGDPAEALDVLLAEIGPCRCVTREVHRAAGGHEAG